MTYGWLVGEVIRRVSGHDARPMVRAPVSPSRSGLRTWIGLPAEAIGRVAWMEAPLPDEESDAARESARISAEKPIIERSLTMGGAYAFPAEDGFVTFNDPVIQAGEIPAANGISTAESLARMFAACVSDVDELRLLSLAAIEDLLVCRSRGPQLSGIPDDGACSGNWLPARISAEPANARIRAASAMRGPVASWASRMLITVSASRISETRWEATVTRGHAN